QMREYTYQRNRELFRSAGFDEVAWRMDGLARDARRRWKAHARTLDAELLDRGPGLFTRLTIEQALFRAQHLAPGLVSYVAELQRLRLSQASGHHPPGGLHHAMSRTAVMPAGLAPQPSLDAIQSDLTDELRFGLVLWQKRREELIGFGGELDA